MKPSVPLKLLYECENFQLTVELDNGTKATGKLVQVDDLMNLTLDDVVLTEINGHNTRIERMMVRGSLIQLIILPPILQYSPFLKLEEPKT
ncbi:Small nuclear ribonucleoprotein Sm D3 [Trachipleistophora hominis]|uniref:Small nuclear ribonucleoprotein Sm D3 n=1 Tax=Trachipleistophora hominis TaxID=72359 RepID=L7K066_TRAHO|nr:Small nuclear ribonucleoprotein Sm D3 [Trachipleistophora hominis]